MINKIPVLCSTDEILKRSANTSTHGMSLGSHFSWHYQHFLFETHHALLADINFIFLGMQ